MIKCLVGLVSAWLVSQAFHAEAPGMQSVRNRTRTTEFFRIRYEKNVPPREAQKVGILLESAGRSIGGRLNLRLNHRFDVVLLASSERLKKESRSGLFEDGLFKEGKIYLITPAAMRDTAKARAVTSRLVANAILSQVKECPAWLAEAFGIYAGNAVNSFGSPARSNIVSFGDLGEDFARAQGVGEQKEVFAKLGATISFLVARYGAEKVEGLFARFKGGKTYEEVFEATFREKLADIEKAWVSTLTSPAR